MNHQVQPQHFIVVIVTDDKLIKEILSPYHRRSIFFISKCRMADKLISANSYRYFMNVSRNFGRAKTCNHDRFTHP